MDLVELDLRPPGTRQPFHFAAHFHYGRGGGAPIVGVLWFEGRPPPEKMATEAAERFASPYAGWMLWPVTEAGEQPRLILGPDHGVIGAIRQAMEILAKMPEPRFDFDRSRTLIEHDLYYGPEPDFILPLPE